MPKSSKRFTLSNSGLNSYGFRMLTAGADLKEFKDNPIMLWMHSRALRGSKDEVLPLGYWDDIKIESDEITAVPFFDDNDPFAMAIYHKVENGTIRTCSAGAIPIEMSEDPEHLLSGQSYPTFTKWKLKEASITDIGANPGALAVALYDENENLINLSDKNLKTVLTAIYPEKMKIIQLNADEVIVKLGLTAGAGQPEVLAAFDNLVKLNADLTTEKQTLTTEKTTLETRVNQLESASTSLKIETLVNQAVTDRKITEGQKGYYTQLATASFDTVKDLFNGMPSAPTVQTTLAAGSTTATDEFDGKTWNDLHKEGKLEKLKAANLDMFKLKYKEQFNRDYKS